MPDSVKNLILVTGPSGVGKSVITDRLHQRLGGDWLLWQADRCAPRNHPAPSNLTPEQGRALDERMFAANIGAIASYLNHDWPVVAELTIVSAREADAIARVTGADLLIIHLDCSPQTLNSHLRERGTPNSASALAFYQFWRTVQLPQAVKISVDDINPDQAVDRILAARIG